MSKKLVIGAGVTHLYACSECLNQVEGREDFCKHCGADIKEHAYSLDEIKEQSDE